MSTAEQLATLRSAMQIVSGRGDASTAAAVARHVGDLAVELATGHRDTDPMPGNRLHRMETR